MTRCGHGPSWQQDYETRRKAIECLPKVPWCVPCRVPLGLCDEHGSTVALGRWTRSLERDDLAVALLSLASHLGVYTGPEQDALIREAVSRLP